MVVIVRIEVDDDTRKAIRHSTGRQGKATRKEVQRVAQATVECTFQDLNYDYDKSVWGDDLK